MMRSKTQSRGGGTGVVVLVVVALIAVVLVIIWARGWFSMDVSRPNGDQVQMTVTLDQNRVEEDAGKVADQARQAGESVSVAVEIRTVEGRLTQVPSAPGGPLAVRTAEDVEITFQQDPSLQILMDGQEVSRDQLSEGQKVLVTYREKDGVNWAMKITVDEADADA